MFNTDLDSFCSVVIWVFVIGMVLSFGLCFGWLMFENAKDILENKRSNERRPVFKGPSLFDNLLRVFYPIQKRTTAPIKFEGYSMAPWGQSSEFILTHEKAVRAVAEEMARSGIPPELLTGGARSGEEARQSRTLLIPL